MTKNPTNPSSQIDNSRNTSGVKNRLGEMGYVQMYVYVSIYLT